jgi:sterol desaturase/sphingolipid hydroxylase (fatty acid hydroxylase superfamily)
MPILHGYDLGLALHHWLHALAGTLTDPASPFWWPSLLAAGAAGIAVAIVARLRLADIPQRIAPAQRRAFLRELPVDLACWLASTSLPFLLGPLLLLLSWAGMLAGLLLLRPVFGPPAADAPAPGAPMLFLAAVLAFACGDFMLYWSHRLFHRVPLLWRAHRLHHAPAVLTPITAFRFWPQEHLAHLSGNVLGQGFGLGLCMAAAGMRVSALTVLGVNVVSLAWGLAFAHLRHSHVPLGFPRWLSFVLVSPHMHQAHHSAEAAHHDRNFGTALALWDWIFGTLYIPEREERFRFGLGGEERPAPAGMITPGPAPARPGRG